MPAAVMGTDEEERRRLRKREKRKRKAEKRKREQERTGWDQNDQEKKRKLYDERDEHGDDMSKKRKKYKSKGRKKEEQDEARGNGPDDIQTIQEPSASSVSATPIKKSEPQRSANYDADEQKRLRKAKRKEERRRRKREEQAKNDAEEAKRLAEKEAAKQERQAREAAEKEAQREAEAKIKAQQEAEQAAQRKAEAKAKRKAEKAANKAAKREAQEVAQRAAQEVAQRTARERTQREAEQTAEREAESKIKAQREADQAAQRKADARAKRKEEKAEKKAAKREAREAAEREAEEKSRAQREAEQAALKSADADADAKAKREADKAAKEGAKREAQGAVQRIAQEAAHREAKQAAEREAETKPRSQREAEQAARNKADTKAKRKAEKKAKNAAREKGWQEAETQASQEKKAAAGEGPIQVARRIARERSEEASGARDEQIFGNENGRSKRSTTSMPVEPTESALIHSNSPSRHAFLSHTSPSSEPEHIFKANESTGHDGNLASDEGHLASEPVRKKRGRPKKQASNDEEQAGAFTQRNDAIAGQKQQPKEGSQRPKKRSRIDAKIDAAIGSSSSKRTRRGIYRGVGPKAGKAEVLANAASLDHEGMLTQRTYEGHQLKWLQEEYGLQYKEGPFSQWEKNAMRDAFADFAQRHDLDEDGVRTLLHYRESLEQDELYTNLCEVITRSVPGRPLRNVRLYIRRNFGQRSAPAEGKPWTKEEDAALAKANEDRKGLWPRISEQVGRSAEACRLRWRDFHAIGAANTEQKRPWTYEEYEVLRELVLEECRQRGLEPAQSDAARLPWKDISKELADRGIFMAANRCLVKWQSMQVPLWRVNNDDLIFVQKLSTQTKAIERSDFGEIDLKTLCDEHWNWDRRFLRQRWKDILRQLIGGGAAENYCANFAHNIAQVTRLLLDEGVELSHRGRRFTHDMIDSEEERGL